MLVGCGSKILGPVVIGKDSKIGANTIILESIEKNKTVVGVKGKVIK